ncbi:uncharacterized protein METZ01_LOCUS434767, partial [marine metagenome]
VTRLNALAIGTIKGVVCGVPEGCIRPKFQARMLPQLSC